MNIGANINTAVGLFAVLGLMLLGLISTYPAVRALEKGRSFIKWYIFSLALLPVALVASFVIKDSWENVIQSKK
jgi:hypothetical protein